MQISFQSKARLLQRLQHGFLGHLLHFPRRVLFVFDHISCETKFFCCRLLRCRRRGVAVACLLRRRLRTLCGYRGGWIGCQVSNQPKPSKGLGLLHRGHVRQLGFGLERGERGQRSKRVLLSWGQLLWDWQFGRLAQQVRGQAEAFGAGLDGARDCFGYHLRGFRLLGRFHLGCNCIRVGARLGCLLGFGIPSVHSLAFDTRLGFLWIQQWHLGFGGDRINML
mmetsp:Transcript_18921/g.36095  ORF Transcript_18921/g.36095 Transcript_18921/m.36095 type:complete len:223 (+) Transcript_18921:2621-3289(+)